MARVVRNRTRSATISGNRFSYDPGGGLTGTGPQSLVRTCSCSDYVGRPISDGTFSSMQYIPTLRLEGMLGCIRPGTGYFQFSNYPIGPDLTGLVLSDLVASTSGWYLDTVARSNPSRPVVTPLTLMQDLVELPAMLRDVGKLLKAPKSSLTAKELANRNLAVSFGWLPLVDDISHLLDLHSIILKRVEELKRLQSGRGMRRRLRLAEDTQSKAQVTRQTLAVDAYADFFADILVERRAWSTIRWKTTGNLTAITRDDELYNLARRVVLGMTREGSLKGSWDLIPWTWLVGWFTNVGKFALANSNTVPASHTSACLMNEVKVTITANNTRLYSLAKGDVQILGVYKQTSRKRSVSGSLVPGFNVPFLDTFRLSILSSLFVQRMMR